MESNIYFINALSAKLGGGKTYIINLLKYLPDNVKIFISCPDNSMLPDDPRVIYLETTFANRTILHRALWERYKLPKLLNKLNVDVLFVPGGMDFTSKKLSIPKVTMFRNMLPFDEVALNALPSRILKLKNYFLKKLMIRTMNSADHIIFISEYAKNSIQNLLKIKSASIIYHGIAKNFVPSNVTNNPEKIKKNNYILYVSRFEPYKNHLNVIKAYSKLSKKERLKNKLVIVGEFMEPKYSLCVNYINDNNLAPYIDIKGKVPYEELPLLYQQASLFVFASSCENCPNILLEAIGCGSAVIASKTEPMPEFARDSALYFNELDPDSIYEKLKVVLDSDVMIQEMRNKSIALREQYSWENTALLTWQCLKFIGDKNV
ncbi:MULTISPECIES: glycosyltransferase family 1 protein [unclassified Pseudoalteromonas]|uniref:glycosyltransferase family 4 protein n=1 Tax=unclassified Pseudoalteromonas TaxID=194690 RepID=UPI00257F45DF|nr:MULTISPECIES: glycosyltransferase family 1 protein [unclassified Pseudoalteromonas]|tara:strand:- start:17518 stop:18645 length:1128 start_codon:yes stop_codon:yes gene_type:complete